jgi:hypothetical protein
MDHGAVQSLGSRQDRAPNFYKKTPASVEYLGSIPHFLHTLH